MAKTYISVPIAGTHDLKELINLLGQQAEDARDDGDMEAAEEKIITVIAAKISLQAMEKAERS